MEHRSTITPIEPPAEANIPRALAYDDVAQERQHRKSQVAIGYRVLARFGLDEGIAGHITVRDPERTTCFWTAPFGRYFGQILPDELLLVSDDGEILVGEGRLNRAAFAIHAAIHAARPDVNAAVHAHGLHGKAFSTCGDVLLPITQDACAFFDDHAIHDDYSGVVFETDEGKRIAATLGHRKAVILANHGHLTVGTTVGSAVWWFVTMERSFQAQMLAKGYGTPRVLPDEVARETWRSVGAEDVGAFAFGSLAERILAEQPDLRP